MEIKQKRHANRIRFELGDEELNYSIEDGSGKRTFSVPYTDISRDRQTLEERNLWLRNVGLLWLALGAFLTIVNIVGKQDFTPSLWLLIGAGCYAVYRLRTTRFVLLPSGKGNLLVIDNDEGQRIVQEVESRRAQQLRRQYDFIDPDESPEQRRSSFSWLHREGAQSEDELRERLADMEPPKPPERVRA